MKPIAIFRACILVFFLWMFVLNSPGNGYSVAYQTGVSSTVKFGVSSTPPATTPTPPARRPPIKKPPTTPTTLRPVSVGAFTSTADTFSQLSSGEISITNPTIRATVRGATIQHAKVVFTYRGATKQSEPLASGELRRQVAIKLLAQDLCNTLYVSWQFAPNKRLEVLEKYNPGENNFDRCGADGYTTISPSMSTSVPAVSVGSAHTLEAEINVQNILIVWADGKKVWEGSVASTVRKMNGPVGLRTDNAAFRLRFYAVL